MKLLILNKQIHWLGIAAGILFSAGAFSQTPLALQNVVHVVPGDPIKVRAGEAIRIPLPVQVDEGFHVNSNKPADEFLIPLRLTWSAGPLESAEITFPKPQLGKYSFSTKPVSVFTGSFAIVTRFKVPSNAEPGTTEITGKLHYQACNDKSCLTPKTIDVRLPIEIVKANPERK